VTELARWRSGTVDSGGERIYYEVAGDDDAPTLLLTHGAGGSHAAWFQQVPEFTAAGYRTITWDTRGFGNSSFVTGAHGCDAAVADMTAVLDAAGADRVHVAGQSMGGWWVTAFALAHPERVRSIVLSNTVGALWTDQLTEHFKGYVASATLPDEVRIGDHSALSPALAQRDPARAFLYQQLNTFHTPPMGDVVGALFGTSVKHADIDALGVPVLVITGTDDPLFPAPLVRDTAERLAKARVVEIADAGHSPYFERPDEYNAAVLEFLGALP
jgi:pimeloyl-ACP methyl ester carboxylesterase